jgi:DNA ligase 1
MPFKPMLASAIKDMTLKSLRLPCFASPKLDGIRVTYQNGVLLSRTLKPIPNVNLQKLFYDLTNGDREILEGLDGEFIAGDPTAKDAFRQTTSVVMSDDEPIDGVRLYVFDRKGMTSFENRIGRLRGDLNRARLFTKLPLTWVEQTAMHTAEQILKFEDAQLTLGYEGVMLRSPEGPYKTGRATEKSQDLLKLKRFLDSEAVVIGVLEEMENKNAEFKNELGRTARSSHQAGKVGKSRLGALCVRDVKTGVEFDIGTGFDASARAYLWGRANWVGDPNREAADAQAPRGGLNGLIVKYKYFPTGSKDKPRFPVFLDFRDKRDM